MPDIDQRYLFSHSLHRVHNCITPPALSGHVLPEVLCYNDVINNLLPNNTIAMKYPHDPHLFVLAFESE